MGREFEAGDVRLATVNGQRMLVLRGRGIFDGNWYTQGPVAGSRLAVSDNWLIDPRPLVLIDPEDREQVERLYAAYVRAAGISSNGYESHLADALRSLVEPPRPPEPTGKFAEVENGEGMTYYRDPSGEWRRCSDGLIRPWSQVGAVRVLSQGVAQ